MNSCFQDTNNAQLVLEPLHELLVSIIHHCGMRRVEGCRSLGGSPPLELLYRDISLVSRNMCPMLLIETHIDLCANYQDTIAAYLASLSRLCSGTPCTRTIERPSFQHKTRAGGN